MSNIDIDIQKALQEVQEAFLSYKQERECQTTELLEFMKETQNHLDAKNEK